MNVHFGPAGNSQSFQELGYKQTIQVPEYVVKMGLNAYEYQCGHGVRISKTSAEAFGAEAKKWNVQLSLHAPYYISLASVEEEKRTSSIRYILQSAEAAKNMGAQRIVVHSGSCAKRSREEALAVAKDTLRRAYAALDEAGLGDIIICPETMGKINQLGSLEEVMELCKVDDRLIPCIDFGHLNARTFGGLGTFEAVRDVFETIESHLGTDRLRKFHSHFSKIEYTEKGGEKVHLTFADTIYGPEFEPVAEMTVRKNCSPTFICESAGTQAEDAATMQRIFQEICSKQG